MNVLPRLLLALGLLVPFVARAADVMGDFDSELAFKAFGLIATIGAILIQLRKLKVASRASLKTDLEILRLLEPESDHYPIVKKTVDESIARLYATPEVAWNFQRVGLTFGGAVWAAAFAYWTFELSRHHFSWWSFATGYAAVLGLVWVGMGVTGKRLIPEPEAIIETPGPADRLIVGGSSTRS